MKLHNIIIGISGFLLLTVFSGCDLDVNNPNAPTDQEVLTTPEGIKAIAIGMQGRFGNAVEEAIFISGLISGEIGNTNATPSTTREFQDFPDASANSDIEDTNPELNQLWDKFYGVVKSANDIIDNSGNVTLDPGTRSGMVALAKLLKAMSFGVLIENFQQIPVETGGTLTPAFVDRNTTLQTILGLLQSAASDIASIPPSDEFNNDILATGFDLEATIEAMQARYSLISGAYQDAIGFANGVAPDAASILVYNSVDPNPMKVLIVDFGYFGAIDAFRNSAETGDTRVDQLTTADELEGFGGATLNVLNIYQGISDPIPVFTQDELTLIKAEAQVRLENLSEAETLVNQVRANAGLASISLGTEQAALAEILKQRTYSLYLMGLHWGDLRRIGDVDNAKVAWVPYTFNERATNPNTPANP